MSRRYAPWPTHGGWPSDRLGQWASDGLLRLARTRAPQAHVSLAPEVRKEARVFEPTARAAPLSWPLGQGRRRRLSARTLKLRRRTSLECGPGPIPDEWSVAAFQASGRDSISPNPGRGRGRQAPVRAYANHQDRAQLGARGAIRFLVAASGLGSERQSDRRCPSGDQAEDLKRGDMTAEAETMFVWDRSDVC